MRILSPCLMALLDDLGDGAGADGVAAFANREAQALFKSDRGDQCDLAAHVVARHDHLHPLRQLHIAGNVGGAEVELRTRSEEHTSELQSRRDLVCRLLLEKKKKKRYKILIAKKKKKKNKQRLKTNET